MELLKTVYDNQTELIVKVVDFYCNGKIDVDPTYSQGKFYKNTGIEPFHKFDLKPIIEGVKEADFKNLPLDKCSVNSVMFDPPFLTEGTENATIISRFTSYPSIQKLIGDYQAALAEMYRILNKKGVLIFKCQDTTYYHKNWFIHCMVLDMALKVGFKAQDLFVLTAKQRMLKKIANQEHARKFHSYFWVFIK